MLVVSLPPLALAAASSGASNPRVVNDYLEEVMANWAPGTDIEVLVRFAGTPSVYDLGHLRQAGLTPLHTFHVVPAVYARGTVDAVWEASGDPRVQWIEWNRPLQYFQENSTYAVNATRAWNALIEDQSLQYPDINGRGVTVVVVDSGVDAGHPDLDYKGKTIMNLKSDSNLGWYELENADTSSGHGTHVAGTVAGNGDASAGARKGVAPGANLIGLSTGEAVAIINALGALEWVYDHSRPGNNPYNIRCATNSWGTAGAPYDPNDAIAIATEKLTYENNVVVTFAAGNAGTNDHDGSTLSTNPYSNTPAAISVAAYTRDGTGVSTFSSRGLKTDNASWPDIGAPGVKIESTRARLTLITAEVCISGGDCNPYYMAISGTSMATPHVAGEVALLFQAAPSLRVSDYHADFGSVENTSQEDIDNWFSNPRTRMHEIEVILKLTAQFLNNGTNSAGTDNFVPPYENWTGFMGLPTDFAQGYGFADMNQAIALALALQKIRATNPSATVLDAYVQWKGLTIAKDQSFEQQTDTLVTGWKGEYTRFNDQFGRPLLVQNSTKYVFVPNGTTEVKVDLSYTQLDAEHRAIGSVGYQIDFGDGSTPLTSGPLNWGGAVTTTLSESQISGKTGAVWEFSVVGVGVKLQNLRPPFTFQELRLPYTYGLTIKVATTPDAPFVLPEPDLHSMYAQWRFPDNGSAAANGSIIMTRPVFDISAVSPLGLTPPPPPPGDDAGSWLAGLLALLTVAAVIVVYNRERVKRGQTPIPGAQQVEDLARKAYRTTRSSVKSATDRLRGGQAAATDGGGQKSVAGKMKAALSKLSPSNIRSRLPFKRPG